MSAPLVPPPDIKSSQLEFWNPQRIARVSIFIALSGVGALIKVPSPTGTVAMDSCPGYFSALSFGVVEGGSVAALGHVLSAATAGFPLGVPIHLFIAVQMALWASTYWYVSQKTHLVLGVLLTTILNGVVSPFLLVPFGGRGLSLALILPLTLGSFINVAIAAIAYKIVKKSSLI